MKYGPAINTLAVIPINILNANAVIIALTPISLVAIPNANDTNMINPPSINPKYKTFFGNSGININKVPPINNVAADNKINLLRSFPNSIAFLPPPILVPKPTAKEIIPINNPSIPANFNDSSHNPSICMNKAPINKAPADIKTSIPNSFAPRIKIFPPPNAIKVNGILNITMNIPKLNANANKSPNVTK